LAIPVPHPTMQFLALAAIFATLLVEVSAHSRVWSVWINGSDQGAGAGRYIRQPPTNDPVKSLTSSNIRCNVNGDNSVATYVSVPAGGTVTTEWCTEALLPVYQRVSFVSRPRLSRRRHHGCLAQGTNPFVNLLHVSDVPLIQSKVAYIAPASSNGKGNVWVKIFHEGNSGSWAVEKLLSNRGKVSLCGVSD